MEYKHRYMLDRMLMYILIVYMTYVSYTGMKYIIIVCSLQVFI